jgi:hypothetical protein
MSISIFYQAVKQIPVSNSITNKYLLPRKKFIFILKKKERNGWEIQKA